MPCHRLHPFISSKMDSGRRCSNGGCSGAVYMAIWDWCESELDLDVRFPAPQTEDTLDCALLEGELASKLLAALWEQDLPELAAEIAPDWDLPTEAVQSGLETLRSHLELVQGDATLLYEMTLTGLCPCQGCRLRKGEKYRGERWTCVQR